MTLIEAINIIDALKPNAYTQDDKVAWLSTLDGMIYAQVVNTHENTEGIVFEGYDENTDRDTELIANAPYDEMYTTWLESKIDYTNGEYARYNNSITRFNDMYRQYQNNYNRTHMPLGSKIKYFGGVNNAVFNSSGDSPI